MAKFYRKIAYSFIAFFAVLLSLITAFVVGGVDTVYAADSQSTIYSNVLDDLKKDSSFNASYYPEKADDYSLQIIQLAESSDKELFVYVYQPSGQAKKLTACSINISTTINDDISYYNYKLQLLNSSGVFFKYKVNDFTVKSEPTRYYAISSIYRPFDETIDDGAEHGNTITEVNYNVSKQYCFSMINGNPYVNVVDIETIVVTDKFVGFVRYKDGFKFYVGACDSHFVAFNTDKPIDKLLEADVYYTKQGYSWSMIPFYGESKKFGTKEDGYAYLKYTDKVEHNGGGLFAGTYTWDRIETVEQFISDNDLTQNVYSGAIIDVNVANNITEAGKTALKGKKWVLRFAETSYSLSSGADGSTFVSSTIVGDVTILRLKFETDGVTYNLGTIDNKVTGSDKPIDEETYDVVVNNRGKWILGLLALIILLILFPPLLPFIVKAILWVITLPFKLIGGGVKKLRQKKKESSAESMYVPEEDYLYDMDWDDDFWEELDGYDE